MSNKWAKNMKRLRQPGARRAERQVMSSSLSRLQSYLGKGSILVDLGCGESPDYRLAWKQGCESFGVDLYEPKRIGAGHFVRADISQDLPFVTGSVDAVTCHAVIALLSPVDRWNFYAEVARILKPGGKFSIEGYPLADGYKLSMALERVKIRESYFHRVKNGLYERCQRDACPTHRYELGSIEAIRKGLIEFEDDPLFVRTATILISFILSAFDVGRTVQFSGESQSEIVTVLDRMMDIGILDAEAVTVEAVWLSDYYDDEVALGNVGLILDCMAINGQIRRRSADGGPLYSSVESAGQPA